MKKFLAIILAIAMCITLFPAAYAEGGSTTDAGGYEYVFTSAAYGEETDIGRAALAEKALTDISASASAPWRGIGTYYIDNLNLKKSALEFNATSNRIATTRVIFEVSVPDGGKYIPKLTYTAKETSPIVDVYLGEKPDNDTVFTFADTDWNTYNYVQNVLTADEKLGTIDMYPSDGVEGTKTATFGERTLSAGSYYLCFYVSGENSPELTTDNTTTFEVYLESFELELVPEDNLLSLELSSTSNSVKVNETVALTATATYSLSGEKALSEGVEYVSSDSAVAEVSSDGVITGKKRGTATITATVEGTEISSSVDITVTSAHDYEYDFAISSLSKSDTSFGYSTLKTKTMDDVITAVSDPWKWAGFTYTHNLYSNAAGIQMNIAKNRASGASFVVLELDVKNGGEYVPSLVYKTDGGSPKADVYLIKNVDTINDFSVATGGGEGNSEISQYVGKWQNGEVGGYQLADDAVFSATEETTVTFDECTLDSDSTYYLIFNFVGYEGEVTDYIYYYAKSFALDAAESEPSEIEKAFDYAESNHTGTGSASITAYAVYGTDGDVLETQKIENMPGVTYGEVCESITAPEAPAGYKFLYWAKGMTMGKKQVVSYSTTIPEYRPHEGVNYLIAVYEEVGANADTVEFYNANGQLLDLVLTDENKLPALPSMAGYGKASKWALRNADGTYTEYEEGADVSELSGTLVFMAKYNDLAKDIKVTVNDAETTYYAYGDPVSCTTDAENFSYWTKTVNGKTEIVSAKKEYTFNAYEECTVNAVCNGAVDLEKAMRKIILSTFTAGEETAIMAEFIGFEDALEKGIMFGNRKIAMNTDKTQFTVINDANSPTTVTGYAIINDGALKKITDGELTVSAE